MVQADLSCIKSTMTPLTLVDLPQGEVRVRFGTGLDVELFQLIMNKRVYVDATVSRFIEAYYTDSIYL